MWNEHRSMKAYRTLNTPNLSHVIPEKIVPPNDGLSQELEQQVLVEYPFEN